METMNDVNEIQKRVKLVRNDMEERFPNCRHTVKILLWDDNTALVECRHARKTGEETIICNSVYYDDVLTYEEHLLDYDEIVIDGKGNEIRIKDDEKSSPPPEGSISKDTLYRKIYCEKGLPDRDGKYNTDIGELYLTSDKLSRKWRSKTGLGYVGVYYPEWWLEEKR